MLQKLGSRAARLIGRDDEGATLAEYALLVAFIAAVVSGAVAALGVVIAPLYQLPPGV